MPTPRSRSSLSPVEEELRLPRAPGVIRQFWARHPLFTDILIALLFFLLSVVFAAPFSPAVPDQQADGRLGAADLVPITLAVATCVLLLWRRTRPTLVYIAAVVSSASFLLFWPGGGTPLLLIATYALAVYGSVRACWTGYGIGMGALAVLGVSLSLTGRLSWATGISSVVGEAMLAVIGALIGINIGNRRRYLQAVIDRSRQLLVERDQQAQLAAVAERARIAREMHDIVSHSLTVIVALSEGAVATPDRERARGAMEATAATARSALTEMRAMLGVLRDSEPDAPLAPAEPVAPEATIATAQRAGFPATLVASGSPDVSDQVRFAIGRIVQEGVTNAMRHAPRATSIVVRIEYSDTAVALTIRNDGVPAAAASSTSGFGIRGLQERATHVGGTVASSPDGEGRWMLHAVLPTGRTRPEENE